MVFIANSKLQQIVERERKSSRHVEISKLDLYIEEKDRSGAVFGITKPK